MSKVEKIVHQAIVQSLKKEFLKSSWWSEVQDDVKTRLDWLVEHVEEVGPLFARSFMSVFRWEYERRRREGENVTNPMASYFSTLMGMRISEESYQCGLLPTRTMLNLYDFIEPNDADVAACLMFCQKVELLEKSEMLVAGDELKISASEMAKVIKIDKKKEAKPVQEETVTWKDTDDQDDPVNN